MATPAHRILAIDPGTRYMGLAVLDGDELVYYGVKDLRAKRPVWRLASATREVLRDVIADYRPTVLAYERSFYVQAKGSSLLQRQEAEIERIAGLAKLPVRSYLPSEVRVAVCNDSWATKGMVAGVLMRRFADLAAYQYDADEWRARYWHHMFDALAVGVACAEDLRSRRARPLSAA